MRRSLMLTVAATVSIVLLAMIIPTAVLVRSYALEDRLAQAALEVQATETVVSGQDKGGVAVYLDRVNARNVGITTTVLYPDDIGVGPTPGEDDRVVEARTTGRARVDDIDGGAQILVPVSLGGSSTLPELTPVIRVEVDEPGLDAGVGRAWLILAVLALVLFGGALLLADRLGRAFVGPIRELADHAERLGDQSDHAPVVVRGPAEVRELGGALNQLVARIEVLLERERRNVSDLSHRLRTPVTALRLRVDRISDPGERERLEADVDELEQTVDHIVREARRSEREGLVPEADAVAVLAQRAQFWGPLAEDQVRPFDLRLPTPAVQAQVRSSAPDLVALLDVLLDNVFTHTPEGAAVRVTILARPGGGATLVVEDAGPGLPSATANGATRGSSGIGSTGLGLSIVTTTAEESGGYAEFGRSELGGAQVTVMLGPPR